MRKKKKPVTRFPEVPNAATGKALGIKGIKKQGKEGENAFIALKLTACNSHIIFPP